MAELNLSPNLTEPDEFYAALIESHTGLTEEQSMAQNARLILLLANHIGDCDALKQAITLARAQADEGS
jgi:hypothetical protein